MPTFWFFGARWTAISRPCASNPRPFASFECSTNVEMLPSGSMRVTRAARVSVNSTLPSGIPTGPSAPSNPVLINTIGVPAATTPGMAVSTTRSVGTGSAGAAPPAAGAVAGSAGGAADSVPAGSVPDGAEQAAANRLAARIGIQRPTFSRRIGPPAFPVRWLY